MTPPSSTMIPNKRGYYNLCPRCKKKWRPLDKTTNQRVVHVCKFKDYLKEQLKNPEFKKEYDKVCLHEETVDVETDNGFKGKICRKCEILVG